MKLLSLLRQVSLWVAASAIGALALAWMAIATTSLIYSPLLPSTEKIRESRLALPLRIYSREGLLMAEFGTKRRAPLRYGELPPQLIEAFIAAEDEHFFSHPGFDFGGLARAAVNLVLTGRKTQGGSTITMQLARNYFLSSERSYSRKIKEILLARKIERDFSKRQILELYLNKIYLGNHAYGVGAAAQIYYGREAGELSLAQTAMIAGLPKAPSRFNPVVNPERARARRSYVLTRMHTLGYITGDQLRAADREPVLAQVRLSPPHTIDADYASEMVRAALVARFGEAAYSDGYEVTTTIRARRQGIANRALRKGLLDYQARHGYDGPEDTVELPDGPTRQTLEAALDVHHAVGDLVPALVVEAGKKPLVHVKGSGRARLDPEPADSRRLKRGSVIYLLPTHEAKSPWKLAQWPRVEGALVSLDSHDGAIEALIGGFDFLSSHFNRATQAERQPGSSFKPLIYTAALEKGFTPASVINDAPLVFDTPGRGEWRPENYTGRFYGPTRLREALVHSRNLVSIRLLMAMGLEYAHDFVLRFGLDKRRVPDNLSMALGTATMTPLELARAYAAIANGGYLVQPYLIKEIRRTNGDLVFRAAPERACADCPPPDLPRIASPQTMYLMTSMMQDVIERGTGVAARSLGRGDLAGKTGTTNDMRDAWFSGFNADVVTTCWVGFDQMQPLGDLETGAKAALPIWMTYMGEALKDRPERAVPRPDGLVTVRIDPRTGRVAAVTNSDSIFETFPEDRLPDTVRAIGRSRSAAGTPQLEDLF